MISVGQEMYDNMGNQILVNSIDNDFLNATKKLLVKVSYNDGRNVEFQEKYQEVCFNISDIGIRLFYHTKDIEIHRKLLIENSKYLFNKENIISYFKVEYNKIKNDVKKDEPTGPVMDDKLKAKIIADYYSNKVSLQQEIKFHEKNKGNYFGRIDLDTHFFRKHYEQYLDNHYYDKVYITKGLYQGTDDGTHIVNWRAPIASLYYDNENATLTSRHYVDVFNNYLHGIEIGNQFNVYQYELLLKRNYPSLNPLKYNNTYINGNEFYSEGSADSFLIEVLIENRSNHQITDIIKTIQSNQNKMIRENKDSNMIVQGCAGSGKTMILLHRLSYLKFNSALPNLTRTKIITPNENFSMFIKDLAISLELEEIERITMLGYYISIVNRYQSLYTTVVRKNVQGEKINEREAEYNKKALLFFESENFCEDNEVDKIVDNYYNSGFFKEVEKEYNLARNKLFDNIAEDNILTIAHKLNYAVDKNSGSSDKSYLDIIFNWCNYEFIYANNKLQNDINTLKEKLQKSKEDDQQIKLLYEKASIAKKSFDCISSDLNFIREKYNRVGTNHRILTQLESILPEIQKLVTYKSNKCENFENSKHNIENKIKILDSETKDLTQRIQALSFYQIIQKRDIINQIHKIEKQKKQLLADVEYNSKQNEQELKVIINTAYNLISDNLPNSKKADLIEDYLEQVYSQIQNNKKSLEKDMPSGISFESDYFIKYTVDSFEKNKLFVNLFLEKSISIRGDFKNQILRLIAEYNKCTNDLLNYIGLFQKESLDFNSDIIKINEKVNNCTKVLLDIECLLKQERESVYSNIHTLSTEINAKESNLLNEPDLIVINNACSILDRRGLFVLELFEKLRNNYRNINKINTNYLIYGKHELILLVFIYYLHCKELKNGEVFLFVDEGQDYSPIEYRLLYLVNGEKCVFNIFGDVNQCINIQRGIKSWGSISEFLKSNNYVLNENYRNSVEITNFTNNKFNLESLPIGVHGTVVTMINGEEVNSEIKKDMTSEDNVRIAIISKDNEFISQLKKQYPEDKLFFGSVIQAKGLEFDNVYVYLKDMNKNEQYISCTRALNKLTIIN